MKLFEHLERIHPTTRVPRVSDGYQRDCLRTVKTICSRTGLNCWFNRLTGHLFFAYGDVPSFGVLNIPCVDRDGSVFRYQPSELDDLVEMANRGRNQSLAEKERIERENAKAEADEAQRIEDEAAADRRPELERKAQYLSRQRRGLKTVSVVKD